MKGEAEGGGEGEGEGEEGSALVNSSGGLRCEIHPMDANGIQSYHSEFM